MNEYLKGHYNILKENLTMIAIIPTILGAIWQLFMLSSISSNLVRFFSASQLISDGILVLGFFIFPFIMSYQILMKRNMNEKKKENINLPNADKILIIIVMTILILVIVRIVINFQKFIQLNDFESLFYILFISGFIANIIFAIINEFFKSHTLVIIYSLCTFMMGFCIGLKFDFKQTDNSGNFKINHYHQNYGYDVEASLEKHSIKELNTPKYKEDLLNSLKKGNLQSVTFVVGGVESKMFVEANPQFKTLNVYDGNLQRINHRESKEEKKSEGEKTSEKQSDKKQSETAEQNSETPSENKPKKRKQQSNSV